VVGNVTEVNIEKILLLKPDVVFASGLTDQRTVSALEKNGVNVHRILKVESFDQICSNFLDLGKQVGQEEIADSIVKQSLLQIDSLKNLIHLEGDSLDVFFQIGANPLFAVIPNTFMDDLIRFSACKNIAFDMSKGTISRESVIKRNPDVIYIATMGLIGEDEKKIWQQYTSLKAVQNDKVFMIDSDMACFPTVVSFTESLKQIIHDLYGREE